MDTKQLELRMYLICGEALYDVFIDPMGTEVPRKIDLTAKPGGSPYNVAIGLARLSCPVALATELAEDTLGRHLDSRLRLEGVDLQFVRHTAKATPFAMVDVDRTGSARYEFYGLDRMLFHPELEAINQHWKRLSGVHLGSIPIVAPQSSQHLLDLVQAAPDHVLVSFDPNVRLTIEPNVEIWRSAVERFRQYAHLIKVSEEDLTRLYGADCDIDAIARSWIENRCSLVAVTRGARGATYFSRQAGRIDVLPVPVVVADTVGAGDSFQAAMLAWLAESRRASPAELVRLMTADIKRLGEFAARAAAATCRHRGPEFPYRKNLPDI